VNALLERARAWLRDDPDALDRDELTKLIHRVEEGDGEAERDLADRFSGPLTFGTAGLRGVVGAGENRLNTSVVLRATWGLVDYILANVPEASRRGIVIGHDARLRSDALAIAAAEVAAARGVTVHILEGPSPTPLVAFLTRTLHAAGGIVVTASHNPPEYNGYKVYLDRGAQIIPPHDEGIAARIAKAPPAREVQRMPLEEAEAKGIVVDARMLEKRYVDAILGLKVLDVPAEDLTIAYTPLHGVGARLTEEVLTQAGFTDLNVAHKQAAPDGRFPTVRFPNPEEPGAMDQVLALGERVHADLVLAQDPDADRLAAAVRGKDGKFVVLTGNELGILLAHHVLTREAPDPKRLVITTVVSSAQLKKIAADLGVHYAETLTGFKWIANYALDREEQDGLRFVFGYEEALGYTVHGVTRDKDGVGAALVMAELAAQCKGRGETVLDRLRAIRERYGLYVSRQRSVVLPGREGAERIKSAMTALRGTRIDRLGTLSVEGTWDLLAQTRTQPDGKSERLDHLAPSDVLIYDLEGGGRAAMRPSGTEPKIKLYLEIVESLRQGESLEVATARGQEKLDALESALRAASGL
jgi:phosphomannomutase